MRIISRKTLIDFWKNHADAEQPLKVWFRAAKAADWKSPNEVKIQYRNVSIVANNRLIFNIAGNKYRLVVAVNYNYKILYIRFVGTHSQYNKIDVKEI